MTYPPYTKPPDEPPKELRKRNMRPIGECIYCGWKKDLTTEHVVPRGMRGRLTLPKGSCKICACVINKKIEDPCMSNTLIHARVRHQLHRTPRKGFSVIFTAWDGTETEDYVSIEDFPMLWIMQLYEYPRILSGTSPSERPAGMLYRRSEEQSYQKLLARPGVKSVSVRSGGINSWVFARWIAKIGYSYAVACLGLDAVKSSFLRDMILNGSSEPNYLIGGLNDLQSGSNEFTLEPPTDEIFRVELKEVASHSGVLYWVTYVRLLPILQGASYLAVVGEKL